MTELFKKNWSHLLLSVLVICLFSLRFANLTAIPVFADEAIYIRWSQVMKAEETLRFLPLSDGKQPLFMWMAMFPLKLFSDPLFAGRVTSVLAGFGTLVGVSLLSFLLFKNRAVMFTAALIYAVSPYAFFFDRLALADSLLAMFGVWTFILSYLAVTKGRLDYAMLAGFALGGAWLTKSPALFFVIFLPAILIFSSKKKLLISIFHLLVTVFIGYGMYNILRLGPNFHQLATRNADYVYPLSHILSDPLNPFRTFLLMSFEWISSLGPLTLLLLGGFSLIVNWKKNWKQLIVLGLWFSAPIFIQSEFAKVFTARYIYFTIPFLIVISSAAFITFNDKLNKIVIFVLALFVAQSLVFNYSLIVNPEKAKLPKNERAGYLEEWTAGQGIKDIADYLRDLESDNPDVKIVVGTEGYFGTLPDGMQMYLNDRPGITVIGTGLDFTKLPSSLIDSFKSGNKTYLVVNNERFRGDADKLGLSLIGSYDKATRPDGTFQSLLFFELVNQGMP